MAGTTSIGGLASGLDTTTLISQLMQLEARPQTLLKKELAATKDDAAAYRDINASFAALITAAKELTGTNISAARTAASSNTTVTATATTAARAGSVVAFEVTHLAAAQTLSSATGWSSATTAATGLSDDGKLVVQDENGDPAGEITFAAGATLTQVADAINTSTFGLKATIVKLEEGDYRLQVTAKATGTAEAFTLRTPAEAADPTIAPVMGISTAAADATLMLEGGLVARSSSNTFKDLITGVSVTVSEQSAKATISVANDTEAITGKVQGMVNAANAVLSKIQRYTDTATGSTAPLKGDFGLRSVAARVLQTINKAVGADSVGAAGLQLTKTGQISFKPEVFKAKLISDPELVQKILGGQVGPGTDKLDGTIDDVIVTDGVAARLQLLGHRSNDSVNGQITLLAGGEDKRARELQRKIEDWDRRLALRQETLTRRFTAMESALGGLKNKSSWLSSQIASLPTWSSSKS